jgi:hypothetical protein
MLKQKKNIIKKQIYQIILTFDKAQATTWCVHHEARSKAAKN